MTTLERHLTNENRDAWKQSAVCAQVDPELFFPERGESNLEALRLCESCPVRKECLDYALEVERGLTRIETHGIIAGLTPGERLFLRGENYIAGTRIRKFVRDMRKNKSGKTIN